jgi:hypothetical protein
MCYHSINNKVDATAHIQFGYNGQFTLKPFTDKGFNILFYS